MASISLKMLKENLSEIVERVSKGEIIEIFKYNKPYVKLVPMTSSSISVGRSVGRETIKPAIKGGTRGKALKALSEDRDEH